MASREKDQVCRRCSAERARKIPAIGPEAGGTEGNKGENPLGALDPGGLRSCFVCLPEFGK